MKPISIRGRWEPGKMGARWGSLLVLSAVFLAATPACSLFFDNGPTPVAQGQYYASGEPEYDEFFLELYRTQVAMAEAPERFTSAHTSLVNGLGLSSELPQAAIVEHVRARANELADDNRIMKLQLNDASENKAPSAVLRTRPAARDGTLRQLAEPVEKASNELLILQNDLQATTARLDRLERRLKDLKAKAPRAFRDSLPKRREVERNLEDADRVITYMRDRSQEHLGETKGLLDGLVAALDTSNGAFDRPTPKEPEPEEVAQPTPPAKKKAAPARPRTSQAAAKPKPAPSPQPAASKPTPSAPPAFEP